VPSYDLPLTHRPMRDGSVVTSRHVPYFLAAEVLALAWATTLRDLGPGVLTSKDVAVVNAHFDFSHELFTGQATFSVEIEKLGTTSIRFGLRIEQDGKLAATGSTTVVQTDEARTRSIPLSSEQRAALERVSR
jgi:acyl-CoA thioesterase FadM